MRAGLAGGRGNRGDVMDVMMEGFEKTIRREQQRQDQPNRKSDPLAIAIHHGRQINNNRLSNAPRYSTDSFARRLSIHNGIFVGIVLQERWPDEKKTSTEVPRNPPHASRLLVLRLLNMSSMA